MLGTLLQNSYVFAVLSAVITAVLAYGFSRVTEPDPARWNPAFFKTLVCALAAGLLVAYLASPRAEPFATEPFDVVAGGGAQVLTA